MREGRTRAKGSAQRPPANAGLLVSQAAVFAQPLKSRALN